MTSTPIRVIGIGAGGHASVVIEILRAMGGIEIVGLVDANQALWGQRILGIPVLGSDDRLVDVRASGVRAAFIGVGSAKSTAARRRLFELLRTLHFESVSAIHPSAIVSPSASLGDGVTLMAGTVVNARVAIAENVIVNTGSIVEHDCTVGAHVHLATGVRLAGGVRIGNGCHIGVGVSVRPGVRIGRNAFVAMGSVVVSDVPDEATVMGVPARITMTPEVGRA